MRHDQQTELGHEKVVGRGGQEGEEEKREGAVRS